MNASDPSHLASKLGIKPGQLIALVGCPTGWQIDGLPEDVRVRRRGQGDADVIVAFFDARAKLQRRLPALLAMMPAAGALWIAWPRRAAGHMSDITDARLREIILPTGLVDTKVAALGEHWSGLRFVWRKELRVQLSRR